MTKELVLKYFLQFVSRFIAIPEAKFATLGGEGREAKLWQETGIPADNGWLIERGNELSKNLIRHTPYHVCSSLAGFPKVLRSIHGQFSGIDAFHLDLCGTIEPNIGIIKPLMPLVSKFSEARCFAMTVADQRFNRALRKRGDLESSAKSLLGQQECDRFLFQLRSEQKSLPRRTDLPSFFAGADPEKGVTRELSVFLNLLDTLRGFQGKIAFIPDEIARYIYISRMSGRSCRMRTYLMHFSALAEPLSGEEAATRMAEAWLGKPVIFINRQSEVIEITGLVSKGAQSMSTLKLERIHALAIAAQGEVLEQYEALVKAATGGEYKRLYEELLAQVRALGSQGQEQRSDSPSTASPPVSESASGSWVDKLDKKTQVAFRLLRAKSQGEKQLVAAYKAAKIELGLKRNGNSDRKIGGTLARTQKTFRGQFVARILASLDDRAVQVAALSEMSSIYGIIDGGQITPSALEQEAKKAQAAGTVSAERARSGKKKKS